MHHQQYPCRGPFRAHGGWQSRPSIRGHRIHCNTCGFLTHNKTVNSTCRELSAIASQTKHIPSPDCGGRRAEHHKDPFRTTPVTRASTARITPRTHSYFALVIEGPACVVAQGPDGNLQRLRSGDHHSCQSLNMFRHARH